MAADDSDMVMKLTSSLYERSFEKGLRLCLGGLAAVGDRPLPARGASVAEWETKYGPLLDATTNMRDDAIAGTLVVQWLLHTTGEGLRSAQRGGVLLSFPLFSLTDPPLPSPPPLLPASPSSCSSACGTTSRPPLAPPRTSPS